ncbi:MAG TPA: minichromosome maintenance protein MCM [Alphaproteobacteria bacterium]|nr:minichromosome maintenance protein MCM [Alphaproteobacteria bacterium]
MDITEQIEKFHEFFNLVYHEQLHSAISKGEKSLSVNFSDLGMFNLELAQEVLENPEDSIRGCEIAIEQFDFPGAKEFKIRFRNLPKTQEVMIRDIRSTHLQKFIQISGIIRQKTDVRPQVTTARFECPSCGNTMTVLQLDTKFREPTKCSCGRKGRFRLMGKEMIDAQKIVLEEAPEDIEGSEQPKRMDIFLKQDLVSPMSEKKTNPGSKNIITGILKEVPILARDGGKLTRFDLMIEANHVESVAENFSELNITPEEIREIREVAEDPKIYKKITGSIAPGIYGHDKVKEALVLQLFGGVRKVKDDRSISRGDIHVLLIGDPGSGKSQMLKRISIVAPKSRYVSGKSASAAGLTATVVKDDFLKGYALEAGALVLTNKGICCIDEMDKMTKEDTSAMHEALEQQTISINKANISATLRAETTVLAAANPKFGRFDPYELIPKQIELPSTLINRFDLIFPIRDIPNKAKDERTADFILQLHKKSSGGDADLRTEFIKKYVAYARQNINPQLTEEALEEIKEYYVKMRSTGDEEGAYKAIPISARQLEALIRLSEASARVRLSPKVLKSDARRAIELVHFCLTQIGVDPETGKIDIDRITTGVTASQRSNISIVKEIIKDLEGQIGKQIPVDDVLLRAKEKGLDPEKAEDILDVLKKEGVIFAPRAGFISRI